MPDYITHATEWPADALEYVPACPICGSEDRQPFHSGLRDQVFRVAPGEWSLFHCQGCGSAWLDPRPKEEFLPLAYEAYFTHSPPRERVIVRRRGVVRRLLHDVVNDYLFRKYGVLRAPGRAGWLLYLLPPLRSTCDAMCRHLPAPRKGSRLLDVGCGNGGFLLLAREMGWDAEGLDFDESAAAQAGSQGFRVTVGGIDALSSEAGCFDAITSSHVLEHVTDPVAHVRALFKLLKPGGVLWLQTPNIEGLGARLYGRHWRDLDPPRHLALFSGRSLRQLLSVAGFVNVEDKPDFGQAFIVLRASEAIKRGSPVEESSSNKARLPFELVVEGIEWCVASSREFLTIMCRKPEV